MTVTKLFTNNAANTGAGGREAVNPFVDIVKRYALTPGFSFATAITFSDKDNVIAAIRSKNLIPLPTVWEIEETSVDTNYANSSNENIKRTRRRKRRFIDKYDVPLDVHQALKSLDQINYGIITIDGNNNVKFFKDGDLVKGFSTSTFSVEDMMDASQDGGTPALTPVYLCFKNNDEWDKYGSYINPDWNAADIEPLTSVYVEQVGTATATALTLRVYANGGFDSDGILIKVPIAGLVKADFTATTGAGADQTSALSTFADNGDGTYTFVAVALASGTVNLVEASSITDTDALFDSHFGAADGEATLTVTIP